MMRLQDSLSLIDIAPYPEDSNNFIWWVWLMKEYGVGESWTLLYRVQTGDTLHGLVGFRMNGDLVMATDEGSFVTYDPESKQVKDLGIHGIEEPEGQSIDSVYLGRYMESLVLLDRTPHPRRPVIKALNEECYTDAGRSYCPSVSLSIHQFRLNLPSVASPNVDSLKDCNVRSVVCGSSNAMYSMSLSLSCAMWLQIEGMQGNIAIALLHVGAAYE
ncbi:hypothetical protein RHSIM_Rhsim12G0196600 [Rhododendron simsii]|uniref:F-box associated domain-containing protein n=1 Tax=Rhododendron simsii TaxID=118357 RepID=A0A834G343_RHOSS|nr:hypothetical protein RHSIM_Rhsim12G0196600 [Rhododendron simsii]